MQTYVRNAKQNKRKKEEQFKGNKEIIIFCTAGEALMSVFLVFNKLTKTKTCFLCSQMKENLEQIRV